MVNFDVKDLLTYSYGFDSDGYGDSENLEFLRTNMVNMINTPIDHGVYIKVYRETNKYKKDLKCVR